MRCCCCTSTHLYKQKSSLLWMRKYVRTHTGPSTVHTQMQDAVTTDGRPIIGPLERERTKIFNSSDSKETKEEVTLEKRTNFEEECGKPTASLWQSAMCVKYGKENIPFVSLWTFDFDCIHFQWGIRLKKKMQTESILSSVCWIWPKWRKIWRGNIEYFGVGGKRMISQKCTPLKQVQCDVHHGQWCLDRNTHRHIAHLDYITTI